MTTPQNIDYCTGQCWYDNYVVSPPENPDVVYLGGSFSYGEQHGVSNGRAVLLSTDGGATWSDLTLDQGNDGWLHPDQHALVTVPGEPLQFIAGNDGGVVRSNGKYVDASAQCDTRGLSPASTAFCKSLLNRIPDQTKPLNKGLTTLQFQSLSFDPTHPQNSLMGGTQDNGTFEFKGSSEVWPQIIYGDGGQSGWNAADSTLRFNSFFGQNHDANFRNGEPDEVGDHLGQDREQPGGLATSTRRSSPTRTRRRRARSSRARRASGGPRTGAATGRSSRRTAPSSRPTAQIRPAVTSCASARPVPPISPRRRTAPTAPAACVAAVERAGEQHRHACGRRRTRAACSSPTTRTPLRRPRSPGRGSTRRRPIDPSRFVSSIYVDPANPNHAWISYSGYNINTPAQPGHVFEVTRTGATATWVDRTLRPGRPAGHRPRPRRPDRRPLRRHRLRRHEARRPARRHGRRRLPACRRSRFRA